MKHCKTNVLSTVDLCCKVLVPRRLRGFDTCCRTSKSDIIYVDRDIRIYDGSGRPSYKPDLMSCGKICRAEIVRFNYCQLQRATEEDHRDDSFTLAVKRFHKGKTVANIIGRLFAQLESYHHPPATVPCKPFSTTTKPPQKNVSEKVNKIENGSYIMSEKFTKYDYSVINYSTLVMCYTRELMLKYHIFSFAFYPRNAMLARVIEIATCLSVCLSVCPSVTRQYCVKTKKASGMISSPSDNPKTLVF